MGQDLLALVHPNFYALLRFLLQTLCRRYHDQENWVWWLQQHGVTTPPSRVLSFDSYANVLQMALDGQAVALGFSPLVDALVQQGRLMRPIGESLATNYSVYMVRPNGVKPSQEAQQFIEWIFEQSTAH